MAVVADTGGTSYDVSVVRRGRIPWTRETWIGEPYFGHMTGFPSVDVRSVGAGGGSIARVDSGGLLHVGPESAGADPGPVCFSRGGERPTLTDAALCLGYLSDESFLGAGGRLDVDRARGALDELGSGLGLSWSDTAAGIVRVAESQMSDLVRRMVVSKGHDPRDFSVLAYGGAGPVHATGFSRDLSVASIVVPAGNSASVWSAYGVATSDIKHVYEYAAIFGEPLDPEAISAVYEDLAGVAREQLSAENVPLESTEFHYEAGLHYKGQLSEVYVPIGDGERLDSQALADAIDEFERRYSEVFGEGSAFRQAGVELVDFRLTTVTPEDRPPLKPVPSNGRPVATGDREVRFVGLDGGSDQGPVAAAVFEGEALGAGAEVAGPAAIELPGTTIVVAPDYRATRHESGSFVLEALEAAA
jgi:N-methylhydantoinase A